MLHKYWNRLAKFIRQPRKR